MLSQRFKNDGKPIFYLNELQKEIKKRIEEKIKRGIYSFEKVDCLVCKDSDLELLSEKDRYGLYHPVVICKNCGLIQQNPRMNQKSYNYFYESEYRRLYGGENMPTNEFFADQYDRGKSIYIYLKDNLSIDLTNLKILEIGTGAGGILQYFKEKDNEIFGIDLDSEYIKFGKNKYNLNLKVGTLNDVTIPWIPDIIIYSHVFEHLLNPVEELIRLKSLISENSYLYIEVPGIKNLAHSYGTDFLKSLQNAHIYYFTLTTLKNVLKKSGYEHVYGDEFVHSIFKPVTENKKFDFKNDYRETITYLKKMEWYRFIPTPYRVKVTTVKLLKSLNLYNFCKKLYHKIKR